MATVTSDKTMLASKDPNNARNYGVRFDRILPDDVTLSSAVIVGASDPTGLTVDSGPTVTGDDAIARFSGGTDGVDYSVTFRGTFSDGETDDRTIIIPVRSK